MGRFDDAARRAREKTNARLADFMGDLAPADMGHIRNMIPSEADRKHYDDLCQKAQIATNSNERKQAFAAFCAIASEAAVRVVKQGLAG